MRSILLAVLLLPVAASAGDQTVTTSTGQCSFKVASGEAPSTTALTRSIGIRRVEGTTPSAVLGCVAVTSQPTNTAPANIDALLVMGQAAAKVKAFSYASSNCTGPESPASADTVTVNFIPPAPHFVP